MTDPKAALWLFSYQGAEDETWLSIIKEMRLWADNLEVHVKAGDADIARARSKVASWFLQSNHADILLMVDSDNAWEPGDLKVIAKKADEHTAVVGGIYPKRAFNQGAVLRVTDGIEGDITMGKDALIDADFVGAGFMAIPRMVLECLSDDLPKVREDFWPFFMPMVIDGPAGLEYGNEDQSFCHRVRDAGFRVYAATLPRVTHKGPYMYRMVDSGVSPPRDRDITIHLERTTKVPA